MTGEAILTAAELDRIRREYRARVAPARPLLPRPGDPRLGARAHRPRRDWVMVGAGEDVAEPGQLQAPRARRRAAPRRPRPRRRASARSTTSAATAGRRVEERGAARPSASSARTTPGSTTSTARSSGPSTPRTSTTSASRTSACGPSASTTWQGFVFLNLDPEARRSRPARRPRRRTSPGSTSATSGRANGSTYDVDANWKFIAENYSECYHCPGIHPQLNKLTPYDLGGDYAPTGRGRAAGWSSSTAPRRWPSTAATGRATAGRRCAGMTAEDERPDLLLRPLAARRSCRSTRTTCSSTGSSRSTPGHTRVICELAVRAGDDRRARTSTRPTRSPSGTSPTARTGTSASSSSAARGPAPGSPAATRTRRPRSTRSTSWSRTATRPTARRATARSASATTCRRRRSSRATTTRAMAQRHGANGDESHHTEKDRHTARAKAAGRTA